MKKGIILALAVVIAASATAASVAFAGSSKVAAVAAGPSCKAALIALDGPYTGPAASAGLDQRNWGRLFIQFWNAGKPIPGVPKGFKRTKLATPIEVDTQLNAQLAATAAVLMMPYADLPVTRAMQPLKLKEYLATGRPAVVRALPATRAWADCLDLADSPEAFAAVVRRRLATGLPAGQRAARGRLADESWVAKARAFERRLWRRVPAPALA